MSLKIEEIPIGIGALDQAKLPNEEMLNLLFEANDLGQQGYIIDNIIYTPDHQKPIQFLTERLNRPNNKMWYGILFLSGSILTALILLLI